MPDSPNAPTAWVRVVSGNDEVLFAASADGLTWSAPVNLSHPIATSSLQSALAADGDLVTVAWIEEPAVEGNPASLRFRISSDGGGAFGGPHSGSLGDASDPAVAIRGQAVAWSAFDTDKRDILVSRGDDGASFDYTWRAGTNAPGGLARHPSVAVGPSCIEAGVNSVYVA